MDNGFDIIGDIHGCADELQQLLYRMGYRGFKNDSIESISGPAGRKVVFLGDLVDRGPDSPSVLRIVMRLCNAGLARAILGNHDDKLHRYLSGRNVQISHGLDRTVDQFAREPTAFAHDVKGWLSLLQSHLVLDNGRLIVAHAGLIEPYHGVHTKASRRFSLYGNPTGELNAQGLPLRANWAAEYAGEALVVYGHNPVSVPEWVNNTICIDTGCVFGGMLTALRYPELEIVQVPARKKYYRTQELKN